MTLTRRSTLAGLSAAAATAMFATRTRAADTFDNGPMAHNAVAETFSSASGLALPDLALESPAGKIQLRSFIGRTLIISLWAEWCAPCLLELGDMAVLQKRYGNAQFSILPILTHSKKNLDSNGAAAVLAKAGAEIFAPLVEVPPGDRLFQTLARPQPGELRSRDVPGRVAAKPSLPCNLLVDRKGHIVGRQFGLVTVGSISLPATGPGKITTGNRGKVTTKTTTQTTSIASLISGLHSNWSTPDGDAFIAWLSKGNLRAD